MKKYTLLIYILALTGWTFAQNPADEWFEQANAAYNSGNYDTAVVLYEKVLATDMESVPLYYNMGNTYYKMREYPMAIYCYEKALKLDPSRIRVAEFRKVEGDPLARALRRKFKAQGRFPEKKI